MADSNACCRISRLRVAGNLANVYLGEQGLPGYIPGWRLLFVLGGLLAGLISIVIAIFMATTSDGIEELNLMKKRSMLGQEFFRFLDFWCLLFHLHLGSTPLGFRWSHQSSLMTLLVKAVVAQCWRSSALWCQGTVDWLGVAVVQVVG